MPRYPIELFWHEPDASWVANVPDLQFCSAYGDTPEEALAEVQIAMRGWLEAAAERGLAIPAPSPLPDRFAA